MPIPVASNLVPREGSNYFILEDVLQRGGYRTVADMSELLNTDLLSLKEGMLAFVSEDQTLYQLVAGWYGHDSDPVWEPRYFCNPEPIDNLATAFPRPDRSPYEASWFAPSANNTSIFEQDSIINIAITGVDDSWYGPAVMMLGLDSIAGRLGPNTHLTFDVSILPEYVWELEQEVLNGAILKLFHKVTLVDLVEGSGTVLASTVLMDTKVGDDDVPYLEFLQEDTNVSVQLPAGLNYADRGRYAIFISVSSEEDDSATNFWPGRLNGYFTYARVYMASFWKQPYGNGGYQYD